MQKVFEKIIEKLEAYSDADEAEQYGTIPVIELDRAIKIVNQEAEQYNKDNYFNLDHTTLHKCPKCGADAEHRVNRKGLWACGCFKCNLFKTAYDHGKTIESWEDFCAEHNNGWIPCSDKLPPQPEVNPIFENKPLELYLVSVKGADYPIRAFWNGKFFTDGWSKLDAVAWQPLPQPFQKGE